MKTMKNKESGFTIMELLVVIGIIGLLAVILVPRFTSIQNEAKMKTAQAELRTIKSALEMYRSNNGAFPAEAGWDSALIAQTNRIVDEIPKDPFRAVGNIYTYKLNDPYYAIYSYGADGSEGTLTVGTDAVTVSGDGVDNIWVSNCKTGNHNP